MKLKVLPITTWNPTKIFSHEECPLRTQLRYVQRLCTTCFKGRMGYDAPCDKCGAMPKKSAAQQRGIDLDSSIYRWLSEDDQPPPIIASGEVLNAALNVRQIRRRVEGVQKVYLKHSISLSEKWELLPKYTKGPWFWGELDALVLLPRSQRAHVYDWKSGGVNKRTGEPYPNEKYEEQLEIYAVAVLCAYPIINKVDSTLVFLDATKNALLSGERVLRSALGKLKKKWEKRIAPMFADDTFAPRPGDPYCGYCDYSKRRGGPCQY